MNDQFFFLNSLSVRFSFSPELKMLGILKNRWIRSRRDAEYTASE